MRLFTRAIRVVELFLTLGKGMMMEVIVPNFTTNKQRTNWPRRVCELILDLD